MVAVFAVRSNLQSVVHRKPWANVTEHRAANGRQEAYKKRPGRIKKYASLILHALHACIAFTHNANLI